MGNRMVRAPGGGAAGDGNRQPALAAILAMSLALVVGGGTAVARAQDDCDFVRGNVNPLSGLDTVDLNDATEILAYLYLGVSVPDCPAAADVNDNGLVEPGDYTYIVNWLFQDGPPPPAPFPERGVDPTPGISVPEAADARFSLSIGSGAGVPSMTGIELPVTVSASEDFTGIQAVLTYNRRDGVCPDLLIREIRTEEGTLLSAVSAEYIIAEFDNARGVAFIGALRDFATPFWFQVGGEPGFPAGEDQLLATVVVAISACADMGFSAIGFSDGETIPNDNVTSAVTLPRADNLVVLGSDVVRPVLGEAGGIDIRRGFIRGDGNKDDLVDIADPIFLLSYIFQGATKPPCLDSADVNNDTRVDISDPIFLLNYLFSGGPQPSEPFPQAGVDPSDDSSGSLGCASDRP